MPCMLAEDHVQDQRPDRHDKRNPLGCGWSAYCSKRCPRARTLTTDDVKRRAGARAASVGCVRLEVVVGSWEHGCCGPEFLRYQQVRWTCVTDADGRLYETHHDLEGLKITDVAGTVVNLELALPDGTRAEIERVPSGRALSGNDPHDDGEVVAAYTEEVLDASTEEFIVTVELAR